MKWTRICYNAYHGTIGDEMPKSELNEQEFPVKQAERGGAWPSLH